MIGPDIALENQFFNFDLENKTSLHERWQHIGPGILKDKIVVFFLLVILTYSVYLADRTMEFPFGHATKRRLCNICPPGETPAHLLSIGATISPMNS